MPARQARTPDASREDCPGSREAPALFDGMETGLRILVGGWMCLILSQRIERNNAEEIPPAREGGRVSSATSKTIEFPAISKPQAVRSFIHTSIQVPAPTEPPRSCPEFVRPTDRPPIRCATFPSFTKIPHTIGVATPVIPAPAALRRLGEGWGWGDPE